MLSRPIKNPSQEGLPKEKPRGIWVFLGELARETAQISGVGGSKIWGTKVVRKVMSGANVEPRHHLVVPSPPQSWGRCGGGSGVPFSSLLHTLKGVKSLLSAKYKTGIWFTLLYLISSPAPQSPFLRIRNPRLPGINLPKITQTGFEPKAQTPKPIRTFLHLPGVQPRQL